jgi:hypothetical protein
MPSFIKNPIVKIVLGIVVLGVVLFITAVILASLNNARSISTGLSADYISNVPGANRDFAVSESASFRAGSAEIGYAPNIPLSPTTGSYQN